MPSILIYIKVRNGNLRLFLHAVISRCAESRLALLRRRSDAACVPPCQGSAPRRRMSLTKKLPNSLSFRFFVLPLQPLIAQMAESVDALVSNTSGATHPGSSPGLGTKKERSSLLSFFCVPFYDQFNPMSFWSPPLSGPVRWGCLQPDGDMLSRAGNCQCRPTRFVVVIDLSFLGVCSCCGFPLSYSNKKSITVSVMLFCYVRSCRRRNNCPVLLR